MSFKKIQQFEKGSSSDILYKIIFELNYPNELLEQIFKFEYFTWNEIVNIIAQIEHKPLRKCIFELIPNLKSVQSIIYDFNQAMLFTNVYMPDPIYKDANGKIIEPLHYYYYDYDEYYDYYHEGKNVPIKEMIWHFQQFCKDNLKIKESEIKSLQPLIDQLKGFCKMHVEKREDQGLPDDIWYESGKLRCSKIYHKLANKFGYKRKMLPYSALSFLEYSVWKKYPEQYLEFEEKYKPTSQEGCDIEAWSELSESYFGYHDYYFDEPGVVTFDDFIDQMKEDRHSQKKLRGKSQGKSKKRNKKKYQIKPRKIKVNEKEII